MKKAELEEKVRELEEKLFVAAWKNRVLNEVALYYADPLNDQDGGKTARSAIKQVARGYKPVNSDMAYRMKEKEVYPFIEFENYIQTEEEDEQAGG